MEEEKESRVMTRAARSIKEHPYAPPGIYSRKTNLDRKSAL